ncbi:44772_t:CDS:2 [Gigaspora margarita]|uniref:44772_t:CDS:1 n=1 Tax=Gigaspora margarita TaxID=4874 RepID=A0ABN7UQG4_GIGMA|nr:44772_t:CDS:2 [Gigaspora margarita]
MRVNNDLRANEFKNFLLRIENSTEETVNNDMIHIPNNMVINWNNEQLLQTLIKHEYPHLSIHSSNTLYFADKAILTKMNILCNGTKLLYKAISPNVIEAEIATGNHQEK